MSRAQAASRAGVPLAGWIPGDGGGPPPGSAPGARGYLLLTVDQGLLSVVAMGLNLVLIHFAPKTEYALFAMIMSIILLTQSFQNAAVCTPMLVFPRRVEAAQLAGLLAHLKRFNVRASLVAALACGGLVALLAGGWPPGAASALAAVVAVLGLWLRDYHRMAELRRGRVGELLRRDVASGLLLVLSLALLIAVRVPIHASQVLLLLGVANLLVALRRAPSDGAPEVAQGVIQDWQAQIRWSVAGAVIAWIQTSSYPLWVAVGSGASATAEVVATRLFLSPGLVLLAAWGRMGLLQASKALTTSGEQGLYRFVIECGSKVMLAALVYCVLVGVLFAAGADRLLAEEYRDPALLWCWLIVGLILALRSVASVALQARAEFQRLMRWGALSALVSCTGVLTLGAVLGPTGAILGLAVGETLLAAALLRLVRRCRTAGAVTGAIGESAA